jgi:hypothetical protein
MSILSDIPSGVPQGGHLSPLLFILFVNSTSKWITSSKFLLFADDIKIYLKIDDTNSHHILQSELDMFSSWVQRLGLSLNLSKCHVMTFSRRRTPIFHKYFLDGIPLERVFLFKDLGIFLSPSLNFDHHINATVGKALKVLGFIKRNTTMFSSAACLRSLYCALVRSILEYGVIIWHPYLAKDILRIERVQNKFLSHLAYVLKINHPRHDYSLLQNLFNIPTLSSRRQDVDHQFVSSILNGSLDVPCILSNINFQVPTFYSRNITPFHIPFHSSNHNHPLHRMLRSFNNM